jgi:hypothetical protein
MQLKLKRSQRSGGMLGGKTIFVLDARVDPSAQEAALIKKYGLGKMVVYDSAARQKHQAHAMAHGEAGAGLPWNPTAGAVASSLWSTTKGLASAAMASLSLSVTIDGLISGQHIECKDLNELLGAMHAIKEACQTTKNFIDVATTFDGREEVLEF